MSEIRQVLPRAPAAGSFALWNLGFRPFFLFAAAFAALSVLGWAAQFAGWWGAHVLIAGPRWHAHEMIFGYAYAVIVGFLFTAVRNWSNQPTPSGTKLAAIVLLWCGARVLVLTPWTMLAAVADTLFALAATAGIAVPLVKSGNRRNYFFVVLMLVFGAANLSFYLAAMDVIRFDAQRSLQFGLDLILFVMVVMGGRVIPMFTANAVRGTTPRRSRPIEIAALGSILILLVLGLVGLPAIAVGIAAGVAALAHAARLALWQPWRTMRRPILWILHASYAWIVIHLALRALAAAELVAPSLATHALTVGAIGGLTLGMMTRVARGHTARPLAAGTLEVTAYALMQLAAAVRVFVPLIDPSSSLTAIVASGLLWTIAFALFVVRFWPILTQPRLDGGSG